MPGFLGMKKYYFNKKVNVVRFASNIREWGRGYFEHFQHPEFENAGTFGLEKI
jgi:hypothetical protein